MLDSGSEQGSDSDEPVDGVSVYSTWLRQALGDEDAAVGTVKLRNLDTAFT